MQTKFTWEGFENREFCVDFKNDADKMEFLKECEKQNWLWECKNKPTNRKYPAPYAASKSGGKQLNHSSSLNVIVYNPHPIDCSIAENYISERERFRTNNQVEELDCLFGLERGENPQKAVEIVQAWSDEHPIEPVVTYLDKLLEIFSNVQLNQRGTPCRICPDDIGLKPIGCKAFDSELCVECWGQPYKGE